MFHLAIKQLRDLWNGLMRYTHWYRAYISLTEELMRYTHWYWCVYLINIPEPVQYDIYALAFPFDLRCESVTYPGYTPSSQQNWLVIQPLAKKYIGYITVRPFDLRCQSDIYSFTVHRKILVGKNWLIWWIMSYSLNFARQLLHITVYLANNAVCGKKNICSLFCER